MASSPYVVDQHARAGWHMRLDELSYLIYQLAMVDRCWSIRHVRLRTAPRVAIISASRCSCTACRSVSIERRSRSRISAIWRSRSRSVRRSVVWPLASRTPAPVRLQFGKLLPLRRLSVWSRRAMSDVSLDQPAVPLGNLAVQLSSLRLVIVERRLELENARLAVRERVAEIGDTSSSRSSFSTRTRSTRPIPRAIDARSRRRFGCSRVETC